MIISHRNVNEYSFYQSLIYIDCYLGDFPCAVLEALCDFPPFHKYFNAFHIVRFRGIMQCAIPKLIGNQWINVRFQKRRNER
jgi:hypothetical protein